MKNTIDQRKLYKIKVEPIVVKIEDSGDRFINGFHSALCLWLIFFLILALIGSS